MPLFVLVTKLSQEKMKDLRNREKAGHDWFEKVKDNCPGVKFHGHYALLGKYDFLDIYEAANEEEAAKVSLISLANGASKAESWLAIEYNRFVELTKEIV
jgi:uncharacterized protein with GYD domain